MRKRWIACFVGIVGTVMFLFVGPCNGWADGAGGDKNPPAKKTKVSASSEGKVPVKKVVSSPAKVDCVLCPTCVGCVPPPMAGRCAVYLYWNCADDRDCDCIPDAKDKCPMNKENYNGIDDHDGCPEKIVPMPVIQKVLRDSDNDGIVDDDDRCPFEPEDRNGFMDEDGCPDGGQKPLYKDYLNKSR